MSSSLPIGFFDSGVGGLSVYSKFRKLLPNENTLYFADLLHLPYGNKSQEELIGYAKTILDFYSTQGVKAVVIACNTSSAQAYEHIKNNYDFKIYPIIQSCAKVIAGMNLKRVGVFATEATVASGVYTKELAKYNSHIEVKEIACPNWVNIVENKISNKINPKTDIKTHLQEMTDFQPDKIILGCTHYPYLLHELELYAPTSLFIDPADIFVHYIKSDLEKDNMINHIDTLGSETFYVSANPHEFVANSKLFYSVNKNPVTVTV